MDETPAFDLQKMRAHHQENMARLRTLLEVSMAGINASYRNHFESEAAALYARVGAITEETFRSLDLIPKFHETLDLKQLLRQAVFLTTYAYAEAFFDVICNHLCQIYQLKSSPANIQGRGIDRSKEYLVKVVKLNHFFDCSKHWETLSHLKTIRNAFAHKQGMTDNKETDAIKHLPFVNIADGRARLLSGFDEEVLKTIDGFFLELFAALDAKYLSGWDMGHKE